MTENSFDKRISEALEAYSLRTGGRPLRHPRAVLFDMDGILYNSMPRHARAWRSMFGEIGIDMPEQEVYMHEGRTGAATVAAVFKREGLEAPSDEEVRRLYRRKAEFFAATGGVELIAGARRAVDTCRRAGASTLIVTGSGQGTLLDRLDADFDGAFPAPQCRVTAYDVERGKPDPEPFLKGMAKAATAPDESIGVDNAPLGVESASRAGLFTIGVNTGPLPAGTLTAAGADIELNSMDECAEVLRRLLS